MSQVAGHAVGIGAGRHSHRSTIVGDIGIREILQTCAVGAGIGTLGVVGHDGAPTTAHVQIAMTVGVLVDVIIHVPIVLQPHVVPQFVPKTVVTGGTSARHNSEPPRSKG